MGRTFYHTAKEKKSAFLVLEHWFEIIEWKKMLAVELDVLLENIPVSILIHRFLNFLRDYF